MARGRMLSKSLSTSRKFRALLDEAGKRREFDQVLYTLLVAHADDFGRLEGDSFTIKALCYPTSPRPESDFGAALRAMHHVGLIVVYDVDGNRYVQIVQFDEHQTGLHKRTRSRFPEPPVDSRNFPEIPSELKGTEQNGREGSRGFPADSGAPPPLEYEVPSEFARVIADTPLKPLLNGAGTPEFWERLRTWEREYPWLPIREELRSLGDWLREHPKKRRTDLVAFVRMNLDRAIKRGLDEGKPPARVFANGGTE